VDEISLKNRKSFVGCGQQRLKRGVLDESRRKSIKEKFLARKEALRARKATDKQII
jgi:hypothetical protein